MKVLATRRYPGPAFDDLDDVEIGPLEGPHPDVEAVIVANENVPLDGLPSLRLVANFGVGYDRLDLEALGARGIAATNTPGVLDAAVADFTLALVLAVRRRLVEGDRIVRSGGWHWAWSEGFLGREVTGSTLGIVGLGRIGSAVARRAQGFDLRILYTQRTRVETDLAEYRSLDDLLREADVVTIHAPRTPQTQGLIDARRLALLRDGTAIVNTARGDIVNEAALVRELVSGRISAGLDVFVHEPDVPTALHRLPNVVLTPHIGSATIETRETMTRLVVDNILAFERGEELLTPILV